MGILKAAITAVSETAADQWKEVFVCGEMGRDLLMCRAKKVTNNNGNNVITDGSVIIVGEGECAIVTESGKIVGGYDEPGEQIFHSEKSGGIFTGGVNAFFKDVGRRISFGGDFHSNQQMYYINTKEIMDCSFVAEAIPLRYRDDWAGIDIDAAVGCMGTYSFRICNPEKFYKSVTRSGSDKFLRSLVQQMNSEIKTELSPVFKDMVTDGVRPSDIPLYAVALCDRLREIINTKWREQRGIEICVMAMSSLRVSGGEMIKTAQRNSALLSRRTESSSDSTKKTPLSAQQEIKSAGISKWRCSCGYENSGKFCEDCGLARPKNPEI